MPAGTLAGANSTHTSRVAGWLCTELRGQLDTQPVGTSTAASIPAEGYKKGPNSNVFPHGRSGVQVVRQAQHSVAEQR